MFARGDMRLMKLQIRKGLFCLVIIFILGSLLTILTWYNFNSHVESYRQPPHKKNVPVSSKLHMNCSKINANTAKRYAEPWKKQNGNYQNFSSQLSNKCNGAEFAIVTQNNTPLGSQIVYSGEPKRTAEVTTDLFSTFPKELPFTNKKWDTCSVVGNGGILINSKCGKQIDLAQFVIRCNLPPLESELEKDIGKKTDLVTANPTTLNLNFSALNKHRRPFVESLRRFGNSLLLLPTFAFGYNTAVCLRAIYTIEDFESLIRPVTFNPEYMRNLSVYWRSQGLKEPRLSTGFMMVSLALELCNNVNLFGFWPFGVHPRDCHPLTNHYYDNIQAKAHFHYMPSEFDHLLKLHSQGILRIHLGDCEQ